jgi:hypothetical protein
MTRFGLLEFADRVLPEAFLETIFTCTVVLARGFCNDLSTKIPTTTFPGRDATTAVEALSAIRKGRRLRALEIF